MRPVLRLVLMAGLLVLPRASVASEEIEGPIAARLVKVVDGDTLTVAAHIWISQTIEMNVRLLGIDAPELHGECDSERARARQAKDYLGLLVGDRALSLSTIRNDKYGGRVLAHVSADGRGDLSAAMLAKGLARPYDGGKRAPWCSVAQSSFRR